jgi:hypothetical protein
MNVQAKPSIGGAQRLLPFELTALVLQGGGALGDAAVSLVGNAPDDSKNPGSARTIDVTFV